MIIYLKHNLEAVQDQIKVDSNEMLLIINVGWFFPNTKAKTKQLLNILKEYDTDDSLGIVLDNLAHSIIEHIRFCIRLDSKKDAKQLVKNLDQIKIFNGLYGGLDVTEVEELLSIPEIL